MVLVGHQQVAVISVHLTFFMNDKVRREVLLFSDQSHGGCFDIILDCCGKSFHCLF